MIDHAAFRSVIKIVTLTLFISILGLMLTQPANALDISLIHWYNGTADGVQSDYTYPFNIYAWSGTNTTDTVHLNGATLHSLVMTDSSGNPVPYFEEFRNATAVTGRFKIATTPDGATAQDYVFINLTESASSQSNISTTYPLFADDFTTLNTSVYAWGTPGTGGTYSLTDGILDLNVTTDLDNKFERIITGVNRTTTSTVTRCRMKLNGDASGTDASARLSTDTRRSILIRSQNAAAPQLYILDSTTYSSSIATLAFNTYYILETGWNGTYQYGRYNDGAWTSASRSTAPSDFKIQLRSQLTTGGGTANSSYDWVAVRPYTLNEPTGYNWTYPGAPDPVTPTAAFTADTTSGTAPLTVTFTDQSADTPTSWAWDFDNSGSTDSTEQNPSHIYNAAGTYTVKLTVSNAAGSSTETKTNFITVTEPIGTGSPEGNLFCNGDFENTTYTWNHPRLTTLGTTAMSNCVFSFTTEQKQEGEKSAKMECSGSTNIYTAYAYNLHSNKTYTYSAWVYVPSGVTPSSVRIYYTWSNFDSIATQRVVTLDSASVNDQWELLTGTITGNDTTYFMNVGLGVYEAASYIYVDNVSMIDQNADAVSLRSIGMVGDSITAGAMTNPYTQHLEAHLGFSGYNISNRGIASEQTSGTMARWHTNVTPYNFDYIVLLIGTNDIGAGQSNETICNNIATMAAWGTSNGSKMILCSLLPRNPFNEAQNTTLDEVNAYIQALAVSEGYGFIDTHEFMSDVNGNLPASYSSDGVHPTTATGSEVMVTNVSRYILGYVELASDFSADDTTITAGGTVQFTFTGTAADSYEWDFGDETPNATTENPSHEYATAGNYDVTLTVTNTTTGLSASLVKMAYVEVLAAGEPTPTPTATPGNPVIAQSFNIISSIVVSAIEVVQSLTNLVIALVPMQATLMIIILISGIFAGIIAFIKN